MDWSKALIGNFSLLGVGLAVLLYVALLTTGRVLKSRLQIGFGGAFQFFSLLAAIQVALWISYGGLEMWPTLLQRFFTWIMALLIVSGAAVLGQIFSRFFLARYLWDHHHVRVPKLIQDLTFVAILLLGALYGAKVIFPTLAAAPLLAAGGALGIILGLALQSLLGDVFAGLALNIERPFQVGDWVQIGGIHGEVIEINFRATRLRTNDNNYLIIPNSAIAKDHIINFYAPDRRHALRVTVTVDYDADPAIVKKVLTDTTRAVEGVMRDKDPTVRITQFGDFAMTYEIKFWIDDHAHYQEINDGVRTAIWYALKKAKIRIPYPIREIHEVPSQK